MNMPIRFRTNLDKFRGYPFPGEGQLSVRPVKGDYFEVVDGDLSITLEVASCYIMKERHSGQYALIAYLDVPEYLKMDNETARAYIRKIYFDR